MSTEADQWREWRHGVPLAARGDGDVLPLHRGGEWSELTRLEREGSPEGLHPPLHLSLHHLVRGDAGQVSPG